MRQRGYTLVEIMIGMTILSFLFIGGYTAYREFVRRQILTIATEDLKVNLNSARQKALGAERPDPNSGECLGDFLGYSFTFNETSYTMAPNCEDVSPGALSPFVKTVSLSASVSVSIPVSDTASPNKILFKALGGGTDVTGTPAVITLTHTQSGNFKTITVTGAGVIK
ncbi:MAG: Uncharacterized protein G01um10145_623 [Microgenomates group bacterium Gr01-1014_5]|nr:MAG: Uncharacterized protein G01um10145_623 [Microgenomates group bacterium Gr01-1014_5]